MLDSLDLNALAEVIERNRRVARYRWLTLATLLLGVALILIILMAPYLFPQNEQCNCSELAILTICSLLPLPTIIGGVIIFVLSGRQRRKIINQFESELSKLNLPRAAGRGLQLSFFLYFFWIILCVIASVLFDLDNLSGALLILIPFLILYPPLFRIIIPLFRGEYDTVIRRSTFVQKFPILQDFRMYYPYYRFPK
jgi:hypothetical protein